LRNRWLFVLVVVGILVTPALAQSTQSNVPRFNFNVGGGFGFGKGAVSDFVGNSFFGVGGAGINFNRMFGMSAEYMYYDLTIKPSVSNNQGLETTNGALHSISLNGIVRAPLHAFGFTPYGIFGLGFYDRREHTSTPAIFPGASPCQATWVYWWDIYCVGGVGGTAPSPNPIYPRSGVQDMGSFSKIAGGFNAGGGLTYRLNRWHNASVYGEFRYHKAYQSDVQTIVWPVTVGLRW